MLERISIDKTGFTAQNEQEIESCLSLGNGYLGTRNSLEEGYRLSNPATFISGFYETLAEQEYNQLIKLPDWTRLQVYIENEIIDLTMCYRSKIKRYINLSDDTSIREWVCEDQSGRITNIKIVKFISFCEKNLAFKSIEITPMNYRAKMRVEGGIDGRIANNIEFQDINNAKINGLTAITRAQNSEKYVTIRHISNFKQCECQGLEANYFREYFEKNANECSEWQAQQGETYTIEYKICYQLDNEKVEFDSDKVDFKKHYILHKTEWQKYWNTASIKICNNNGDQSYCNFAIYHLLISGKFSGGTKSIPARNLTGDSYNGHIFWDTEIYLQPFFILACPDIAKNLLMYRYNTLKGAIENASSRGYDGADFAWESTDTGLEMTPETVLTLDGEVVEIPSALYEYHISFDITYTIWKYFITTLDIEFLLDFGLEIIFETSKFCASLVELHNDGKYHINKVVGPDEYHPFVNDNVFTNIMAKNNLIIAIKCIKFLKKNYNAQLNKIMEKTNIAQANIDKWKDISKNLLIVQNQETKVFEQFKGYFNLRDINVKNYEPRIVPMDVIIGFNNIKSTQIIKQPDVAMFLYLLFSKFDRATHFANFDYYETRNGHGSSLSPSIHATLAAKLGIKGLAYEYFKKNAEIDIKNTTGNTQSGIHIASIGGVWISIICGFAGLVVLKKGLIISPNLPNSWNNITFNLNFQKNNIDFSVSNNIVEIYINKGCGINLKLAEGQWKTLEVAIKYTAVKNAEGEWGYL